MRKLLLVVALMAALAAGCGGGSPVPHFQAVSGWNVIAPQPQTTSASNVPFAEADRSSGEPTGTIASLPRYGIVIWAQWKPVRKHRASKFYPRRSLPLRVEEARYPGPPEGTPCLCLAANLSAREAGLDLYVWIFFGAERPLPSDIAAADAELARLRFPNRPTRSAAPQSANCPRPAGTGYYDSTVRPASAAAGSTVVVSGRLPVASESGQDVGQNSSEVTAYWNLDLDHWTSISSATPVAAVTGTPVTFGGTQYVAGRCTYRVRVAVPAVRPGKYPIEVLYGNVHGAASFAPAEFRVTKR